MKEILNEMKDITIVEPTVTIKTSMKDDTIEKLEELAKIMTH